MKVDGGVWRGNVLFVRWNAGSTDVAIVMFVCPFCVVEGEEKKVEGLAIYLLFRSEYNFLSIIVAERAIRDKKNSGPALNCAIGARLQGSFRDRDAITWSFVVLFQG